MQANTTANKPKTTAKGNETPLPIQETKAENNGQPLADAPKDNAVVRYATIAEVIAAHSRKEYRKAVEDLEVTLCGDTAKDLEGNVKLLNAFFAAMLTKTVKGRSTKRNEKTVDNSALLLNGRLPFRPLRFQSLKQVKDEVTGQKIPVEDVQDYIERQRRVVAIWMHVNISNINVEDIGQDWANL